MNIIVDENVPRRTVDALRSMGHVVSDVRGSQLEGLSDDALWQQARSERALLITTDKGFTHKHNDSHWGILVVRLRQPNAARIHARILHAMSQFSEAEWAGLLVVMRDKVQSILRQEPPATRAT